MGARGPRPDPDRKGSRIVNRTRDDPSEIEAPPLKVPDPPKGLLKATRTWWFEWWRSDVARVIHADRHVHEVERWAKLRDERERAYVQLRKTGRFTEGSKGQLVLHPLAKYIDQLDKEIRALDDRFGANPRARLSLGLKVAEGSRRLEDLNRDLERDDDEPALSVVGSEEPPDVQVVDVPGHRRVRRAQGAQS